LGKWLIAAKYGIARDSFGRTHFLPPANSGSVHGDYAKAAHPTPGYAFFHVLQTFNDLTDSYLL
jgi:hypothetical protein